MEIPLSKFRRRATLGSRGAIHIDDDEGVLPLHAELIAGRRGGAANVILRALDGEVWVTRRKSRWLLTYGNSWDLIDGDTFQIGRHIFKYQNLNEFDGHPGVNDDVRRAVTWLKQ